MNERLVFVGAATLDMVAAVPRLPAADSRTVADDLTLAGGGPAATAAVTAARLGASVSFVGAVGDDVEGEHIVAGLEAEGVETGGVVKVPGRRSGASVVVVSTTAGARAILTRAGPPSDLASGAALERLCTARWVHADHLGWAALCGALTAGPRPMLSVDAGNPVPGPDPVGADLFVPTLERLRAESGLGAAVAPEELLVAARHRGARRVVATAGADGAWYQDEEGPVGHVPAVAGHVVSTLGAGDVFHGALVAAVAAGADLRSAVEVAAVVATASCGRLDGRTGVPRDHRLLEGVVTTAGQRSRSDDVRSPADVSSPEPSTAEAVTTDRRDRAHPTEEPQ